MRPAMQFGAVVSAMLAVSVFASTAAAETGTSAGTSLMYTLTGNPAAEQQLLASRWALPSTSLRLDSSAGLGAHEVRVLSTGTTLRWGPQRSALGGDPMTDLSIDPIRATYRYTLLAQPAWAMKFGLSTNLGESSGVLRPVTGAERSSFGSLPLLHFAGIGQWSPRWRMGVAVDGLATMRGRALDLGLQVDYLWSDSMSLYGEYQLTDSAGEAEGYYGSLSNRANIGLRYRF